jgi:cobalt transporter subunit CbtA
MSSYLRIFLTVAMLAGISAGVISWAVQMFGTTPLILEAEVYETSGAPAELAAADEATGHSHEAGAAEHEHDTETWAPSDGWERNLYTLGAAIVTGVGFAFLLTAAIVFLGKGADWRRGLLWGLAGFASFSLAPALGLPPELPGTEAAPLPDRQLWWIGTAVATAAGLFAAARLRNIYGYAIALVLIAAPHVIGAPHPVTPGSLAPEALEHKFILVAIASSLVFWLALGALTGAFLKRFANDASAAA